MGKCRFYSVHAVAVVFVCVLSEYVNFAVCAAEQYGGVVYTVEHVRFDGSVVYHVEEHYVVSRFKRTFEFPVPHVVAT